LLTTDPNNDEVEGNESEKDVKANMLHIELNSLKKNQADQNQYTIRNYKKGEKHDLNENNVKN
jgi:hypothetical protein